MTSLRHSAQYRVRFDEAGPDGLLRTSGLLRYAQDVAWQHSEALGFDRAWYAERGLGWVVRAAEIRMLEPMPTGSVLTLGTQVIGWQRIWARRRAECRPADGRLAAWVQTDWVVIGGRGRIARVPPEIVALFQAPMVGTLLRVPLPAPPSGAASERFVVRPHELDPMNHVNNAVYVDWIEAGLLRAGGEAAALVGACPRTYRLEYAAAAAPGSAVTAAAWLQDGGAAVRLTDPDGSVLVRATVVGGVDGADDPVLAAPDAEPGEVR